MALPTRPASFEDDFFQAGFESSCDGVEDILDEALAVIESPTGELWSANNRSNILA